MMKIVETKRWKKKLSDEHNYDFFHKSRGIIRSIAKKCGLRLRVFRVIGDDPFLKQGWVFVDKASIHFSNNKFKVVLDSDSTIYDFKRFKKSLIGFAKELETKTKRKVNLILR